MLAFKYYFTYVEYFFDLLVFTADWFINNCSNCSAEKPSQDGTRGAILHDALSSER